MKKSSFWTFVFSLFPGAGHMYLGLMKKGASLMLLFCLTIALSGFLNLSFLLILLPVIWFYSFCATSPMKSAWRGRITSCLTWTAF